MSREAESKPGRWRWALSAAVWGALFVSTGLAARQVHRFAITSPQFTLAADTPPALTIQGVVNASRWRVRHVFAADLGGSVFAIPLAERRRRLLAVDWVEDASVSRIWPNRLVVRITERRPVAFATLRRRFTGGARVWLIDRYGVLLEPPPKSHFAFPVLKGISDEQSEADRKVRVQAMLRLLEELGPRARSISEIDATSPDDLSVVADMDGRAVNLFLGEGNYARRFENFVSHYGEIQKRSGQVKAFDLRLDDRITAKE